MNKACKRFCDDFPWIRGTNPARMCPIEKEERIERRILKMVKATGRDYSICPQFDTHPWTAKQKTAIEKIRKIPQSKDFLFFLYSPFGTGKTTALLCLCHESIKSGLLAEYTTAKRMRDLFIRRETNYEWFCHDGRTEMQNWKECDILCIDDLGWEGISKTQHFNQNFEPFIDRKGIKTVCASNIKYTDPGFPLHDDYHLRDRFNEAHLISWHDKSHRGRK